MLWRREQSGGMTTSLTGSRYCIHHEFHSWSKLAWTLSLHTEPIWILAAESFGSRSGAGRLILLKYMCSTWPQWQRIWDMVYWRHNVAARSATKHTAVQWIKNHDVWVQISVGEQENPFRFARVVKWFIRSNLFRSYNGRGVPSNFPLMCDFDLPQFRLQYWLFLMSYLKRSMY